MEAAIAAYPQFGTRRVSTEVRTQCGISDNVLNLDEQTVFFVEQVIDQVSSLFPFSFFSIGGDECPIRGWKADAATKKRMKQPGIATYRGIQAWYTHKVAALLRKKGKRIVAWDEVLEDEVDEDAVILSWRGMRGAEVGLARGLDVVSCPTDYCYFDYRQSAEAGEPRPIGVPITLEKAHRFDPRPRGHRLHPTPGKVLGGQANLWSEFLDSPRAHDYAAFPRATALAEVLWSGPGRSFAEFEARLPALLERFDVLGVEYRSPSGPRPWQQRPEFEGDPDDYASDFAHRMWQLRATENLRVNP